MRYDDEHLGDLLRALPPPPVHVVTTAKELFAHFSDQPDEPGAQEDSQEGHDDLPRDDAATGFEPESDAFDGPEDSHEPDGADWN